jgi:hypothetical protein
LADGGDGGTEIWLTGGAAGLLHVPDGLDGDGALHGAFPEIKTTGQQRLFFRGDQAAPLIEAIRGKGEAALSTASGIVQPGAVEFLGFMTQPGKVMCHADTIGELQRGRLQQAIDLGGLSER